MKSKIVRLAVVLALLVSLFAVSAPPVFGVAAGYAVVLGNASAGRLSQYTIGPFTPAAAIAAAQTITVTFPTGTNVAAAGLLVAGNVTVNGTATAAAQTVVGQAVTLTVPAGVGAGGGGTLAAPVVVFLPAAGIGNPTTPSGAAPSGLVATYTVSVVTSADAVVGTSAAYAVNGIVPLITPNLVGGAIAGYTIPYQVGTIPGTYVGGTDTITITFPAGTVLPATISRSTVSVTRSGGGGQTGNPPIDPVVDTANRTVQVTIPALTLAAAAYGPVAAGEIVTIVISQGAGIKNPTTATTAAGRVTTLSTSGVFTGAPGGIEPAATSANITYIRSLTRSPTLGARGATVTLTGQGFQASSAITFTHQATAVGLGTATAASDGTFTGTVSANNPPFAAGANTIVATDGLGGAATAAFTLSGSIVIAPTSGRTGRTVWVTPRDFPATATFTIAGTTIAGAAVQNVAGTQLPNSTAALAAAGLTSFSVVLPNVVAAGPQTIVVADTTNFTTSSATFTVEGRTVALTPTSGPLGTQVTVQGSGFSPNLVPGINANLITLSANAWNTGLLTVAGAQNTDAAGAFVVTLTAGGTAALDALATGVAHTVLVADVNGLQGTATFTIAPRSITISPTTSGRGSTLTVTGTGFRVNGQVTITYAGANPVSATVGGDGTFSAGFTVPQTAGIPSSNVVAATDTAAAAVTALATHTVGAAAVTLSAASAASGDRVTVTGTGFPAYSTLTVLNVGGNPAIPSPAPNADANGRLSASIVVPALNTGSQPVLVTAGGVSATTAITITAAVATPATQLAPLGTNLVVVWGFDAATQTWKFHDPAQQAISDLTVLTRGQGYWLNVTSATTLVSGGNSYSLSAGWNLIGWLG